MTTEPPHRWASVAPCCAARTPVQARPSRQWRARCRRTGRRRCRPQGQPAARTAGRKDSHRREAARTAIAPGRPRGQADRKDSHRRQGPKGRDEHEAPVRARRGMGVLVAVSFARTRSQGQPCGGGCPNNGGCRCPDNDGCPKKRPMMGVPKKTPFGACGQPVDNALGRVAIDRAFRRALTTGCPHSRASRPQPHSFGNKFLLLEKEQSPYRKKGTSRLCVDTFERQT